MRTSMATKLAASAAYACSKAVASATLARLHDSATAQSYMPRGSRAPLGYVLSV